MEHPAAKARNLIMNGLEACQKDSRLAGTFETLVQCLAGAQSNLFPASKMPPDSPGSVEKMRRAMEHLAQALKTLQDIDTAGEASQVAAASIAGALKTLHPFVTAARDDAKKRETPPPSVAHDGDTLAVNVHTALSMATDHQFYVGFSENIEEGGIFVATFDPKPIGSKVVVNFRLPDGRPVTARGVVHFVREYNPHTPDTAPGMGVRFTDLMQDDKVAIEAYMKQRAPMFYDDGR